MSSSVNQVPDYMNAVISNAVEAEAFIRALHADGKLFHFEDSPASIINNSGAAVFNTVECIALKARVDEMFALHDFDPFDIALTL